MAYFDLHSQPIPNAAHGPRRSHGIDFTGGVSVRARTAKDPISIVVLVAPRSMEERALKESSVTPDSINNEYEDQAR